MFSTLDTFDTEYSADSVEWCPIEGYKDIFACGTYQLVEGEEDGGASIKVQKRLGRIYLFRVISPGSLHLTQTLNTHAILDMKWSRVDYQGNSLLGVVNSIGYLRIYRLNKEEGPTIELITQTRVCNCEEEVLALSLDWSKQWESDGAAQAQIAVSDSKGSVSLYILDNESLKLRTTKKLHDFEAWITAFDYWSPNILYSGGDDCKFHQLDARLDLNIVATNKKHGAGVTSIHSNATKEFILATGSYDEILRLWDTRKMRNPISETNLGGGIWRLKWDPFNRNNLLAACMYGGFRVIDCEKELGPQIMAEYNEHKSIAYGCDWSFLENDTASSIISKKSSKNIALVATCSFYDHTLKLSCLSLPDC